MGVHRDNARYRRAAWWRVPAVGLAAAVGALITAMITSGVSLRATPSAAFQAAATPPARPGATGPATGGATAASTAAPTPTPAAPPAATVNADCTLIVPPSPLTAQGLATPYQLTATNPAGGPCHESNAGQAAFVQGAVFDPATGRISVYNPVVVDAGTAPATAPVVPALPAGAIVALWFGFNGNVLTLQDTTSGSTLAASQCVNGSAGGPAPSPFGQMAYCDARPFFRAADRAVRRHLLTVPSPGRAADGLPCLTTRDFGLVDQDQSDNVTAEYLVTSQGQLAQDTATNRAQLAGATVLVNGSDNGLLNFFVDPALGCSQWLAPDLADRGALVPALPLDELQAAQYAGRDGGGPAALVPVNDPMAVSQGVPDIGKTNAYRAGVDQPRLPAGLPPAGYCRALETIQGRRLQQDVNLLIGRPSPVPAMASNLFTFLASRLAQSFANLGCGNYGLVNDVTVSVNGTGAAVMACFRQQAGPLTPGPGNPAAGKLICPAKTPGGASGQSPAAAPSGMPTQPAPAPAPTPAASQPATPAASHSPGAQGQRAARSPGTAAPRAAGQAPAAGQA